MTAKVRLLVEEIQYAAGRRRFGPLIAWVIYLTMSAMLLLTGALLVLAGLSAKLAVGGLFVVLFLPFVFLAIYSYRTLSYPVWACHDRGYTEYRRRRSMWDDKPPPYRVELDGRLVFMVWAGANGLDLASELCKVHAPPLQGPEPEQANPTAWVATLAAEVEDELEPDIPAEYWCEPPEWPHTKADCMPAFVETCFEAPGEPSIVLYQKLDPWPIRMLNERRWRRGMGQRMLSYTPLAVLDIVLFVFVFMI